MVELTVIIKSSDATYKHKDTIYEDFNPNDPNDTVMKQAVENALKNTNIEPESIKIKIHAEIQ